MTRTANLRTLEEVAKQCRTGFAVRAKTLSEGIACSRKAIEAVSSAEQSFSSALAGLEAAKPAFEGSSQYSTQSAELVRQLIEELKGGQSRLRSAEHDLLGLESPTAGVLDQLHAYSQQAALAKIQSRMARVGGSFSLPEIKSMQFGAVKFPEKQELAKPESPEFGIREEGDSTQNLMTTTLDGFERTSELLVSCLGELENAQALLQKANGSLNTVKESYQMVRAMEESSDEPALGQVKGELDGLISRVSTQMERISEIAQAPETAKQKLQGVFDKLGRMLVSTFSSGLDPLEAGKVLEEVPKREEPPPQEVPKRAEAQITIDDVMRKLEQGEVSLIASYIKGGKDAHRLIEHFGSIAQQPENEEMALNAVKALKSIARGNFECSGEASDKLTLISNPDQALENVRQAATAALIDIAAPEEATQ